MIDEINHKLDIIIGNLLHLHYVIGCAIILHPSMSMQDLAHSTNRILGQVTKIFNILKILILINIFNCVIPEFDAVQNIFGRLFSRNILLMLQSPNHTLTILQSKDCDS